MTGYTKYLRVSVAVLCLNPLAVLLADQPSQSASANVLSKTTKSKAVISSIPSKVEQNKVLQRFQNFAQSNGFSVQSMVWNQSAEMYEFSLGNGEYLYSNRQGNHFFSSDLLKLSQSGKEVSSVTERQRAQIRKQLITELETLQNKKSTKDFITFPSLKVKSSPLHTITIFTDVNCGYCRKLHNHVPRLNKAGVTVRYLAYPALTLSEVMSAVWCAQDPKQAITLAKKAGIQQLPKNKQCTQQMEYHKRLGQRMRVRGTPAIVLSNGELISGYREVKWLLDRLGLTEK